MVYNDKRTIFDVSGVRDSSQQDDSSDTSPPGVRASAGALIEIPGGVPGVSTSSTIQDVSITHLSIDRTSPGCSGSVSQVDASSNLPPVSTNIQDDLQTYLTKPVDTTDDPDKTSNPETPESPISKPGVQPALAEITDFQDNQMDDMDFTFDPDQFLTDSSVAGNSNLSKHQTPTINLDQTQTINLDLTPIIILDSNHQSGADFNNQP